MLGFYTSPSSPQPLSPRTQPAAEVWQLGVREDCSRKGLKKLLVLPACLEGFASALRVWLVFVPKFIWDFFFFYLYIFFSLTDAILLCVCVCVLIHSCFMLFFRMDTNSWTSLFNAGRWGFFNSCLISAWMYLFMTQWGSLNNVLTEFTEENELWRPQIFFSSKTQTWHWDLYSYEEIYLCNE